MSGIIDPIVLGYAPAPTAGYQVDVIGHMLVQGRGDFALPTAGDLAPFVQFIGNGPNSAQTGVYTGDRDPNGVVSALPGTIYLRQSGVNSDIYVNNSVGPGAGTSWVATTLGADTWAAVLAAGNVSGGTDAVMTDGDEFRFIDGAVVTRRSDDLNAGEPRTRYFTAAAALAATLSVATATGVLSYTDDLTLASASPVETLGDDTGSPVQRMRKSGAGQTEIEWDSGGVTVWQDGVDANEDRWIARSGVNFPLFLDFVFLTTELRDPTVNLNSPSVIATLGNATGGPALIFTAAAATSNFIRNVQGGMTMWDSLQTHNDANWYIDRYVGGVFSNTPVQIDNAANITRLQDDTIWLTLPSPVFQIGNAAGSPVELKYKADAGSYIESYYNVLTVRWQDNFATDESKIRHRFDAAGAFIGNAMVQNASDTMAAAQTEIGDASVVFSYSSITHYMGVSTGEPTRFMQKADINAAYDAWRSGGITRALGWVLNTDESFHNRRFDAAGVAVNEPLHHNASATVAASVTTLGDRLIILSGSGGSVTLQVPNHYAGESIIQQLKSDVDVAFHDIYSATVQRMRFGADAAEDLYWQKFTGAGALETEIAQFAGGFVRMQTHFGITDGIAAPAALAGYAKFYVDTVDGDYKMIFADGVVALLAPDNVPTQAIPLMWRDTTDLTVDGTAGETNIFTRGIAAGMLLANGMVRLKIGGDLHSESAGATIQLRVYFGATLLYDVTTDPVTTGTEENAAFWFVFELCNKNATNSQQGNGCWGISPPLDATVGIGGGIGTGVPNLVDPLPFTTIAGALDTTVAQTLRVTITWAGGDATDIFTRRHNFLQISPLA
jgi:hypothetical protein